MEPSDKRRRLTPTLVNPQPTDEDITEKDLPLLANVDEVKVHHYLIKLTTDFQQKTARGTVILFLEWLKHPDNPADAKIILDACCLNVKEARLLKNVEEYDATTSLLQYNDSSGNRKHFYRSDTDWFNIGDSEKLNVSVRKWSITISGWTNIPSVVRIDYETLENSPSLHWRPCIGNTYGENSGNSNSINKCAYTPAPPVNNRGLFPCQEAPSAMATWEILLEVENYFTPLVTSDEPGEVISINKDTSTHYFYTSIPLPMSTFAMVIGQFCLQTTLSPPLAFGNIVIINKVEEDAEEDVCQNHITHPCRFNDPIRKQEKIIPVRLFSLDLDCISSIEMERFTNFVYCSLQTCYENFGPHPFGRLDLVIMPKCFPHLGFASPSMVFLSPSNFTGEIEPLFVSRIPHEICHSWFGLLIGALDWTEEWLSEGFSTFCEDIVFKITHQNYFLNKSTEEVENELALKICLRFISLQTELHNTDNELHVMSTNSGTGSQTETATGGGGEAKNGLVPIKQFMCVHYYKGYLFLWHLAFLVGETDFLEFLKEYIWKFHGQLVSSDIFLDCFYEKFKNKLCVKEKAPFIGKLKSAWLKSEKLPPPFNFNAVQMLRSDNQIVEILPLFENAINSLKKVQKIYKDLKKEKVDLDELQGLSSSELLLLFDLIISSPGNIPKICYEQFLRSSLFDEGKQNPDMMHRWCELIVLCKDKTRISLVEGFLEKNMAMGVYLYGELMISEKKLFQKVALDLFRRMEGLYDMGTKRLLKEMLL